MKLKLMPRISIILLLVGVLIQRNERMKYWISFLIIIIPLLGIGQVSKNLELISTVDIDEIGNDVWGFRHSNGIEYAIMGDNNSTRIISLEDPMAPVEVADIEGAVSTWRDFKHFNDVVYVVADRGTDGILVIDMADVSNNVLTHTFLNPEVTVDSVASTVNRCHNLFVNDDGYLYLSGCNVGVGGVIIFDLNADPLQPEFAGIENLRLSLIHI